MSRFRRLEYTKVIGCFHDDADNLQGGISIEMVAIYDSEILSEEDVKSLIQSNKEHQYLMLVTKQQYDDILVPATEEKLHMYI
jgi:hypothetical protein